MTRIKDVECLRCRTRFPQTSPHSDFECANALELELHRARRETLAWKQRAIASAVSSGLSLAIVVAFYVWVSR